MSPRAQMDGVALQGRVAKHRSGLQVKDLTPGIMENNMETAIVY